MSNVKGVYLLPTRCSCRRLIGHLHKSLQENDWETFKEKHGIVRVCCMTNLQSPTFYQSINKGQDPSIGEKNYKTKKTYSLKEDSYYEESVINDYTHTKFNPEAQDRVKGRDYAYTYKPLGLSLVDKNLEEIDVSVGCDTKFFVNVLVVELS